MLSRNFVQRILNILALAFRLMSILYIKFQFIFHPSQLPYRKLWLNFSIKILRLNFPPRCCLSSWKQQQAVVNGTHGQTFQTGLCIHAALGCECFYLKQRYWFVQSRSFFATNPAEVLFDLFAAPARTGWHMYIIISTTSFWVGNLPFPNDSLSRNSTSRRNLWPDSLVKGAILDLEYHVHVLKKSNQTTTSEWTSERNPATAHTTAKTKQNSDSTRPRLFLFILCLDFKMIISSSSMIAMLNKIYIAPCNISWVAAFIH